MIKTTARLRGNLEKNLSTFESKVKDSIIFTGAAAGARFLYEEVKLNTSGARATGEKDSPPGVKSRTLHDAVYRAYSPEKSPEGVKTYHISVNKAKAKHWWIVEFGSSRTPAHPYLRPAASKMREAIAAGKDAMRKRLRGI